MTKDEALKLALEALTNAYWPTESDLIPAHNIKECVEAITAIKEALANDATNDTSQECVDKTSEIVHEPVAWYRDEDGIRIYYETKCWDDATPLYTAPQHTWVGLTDEEKKDFWTADQMTQEEWQQLFAAIEAALKAKNT